MLAILIFMAGDGVEQAFLSKYMVDLGFSIDQSALVFSIYGITLALGSWLAGVLSEAYGPRRIMLAGLVIWVLFEIGFLVFGLGQQNLLMILLMYGIRGFGYPLFAFAFIVWVAYITEEHKLATAMGWFFFMFSGGIGFLGAFYPSIVIDVFGYMGTLWSSLIWIILGGVIGILAVDDKDIDGNPIGGKDSRQTISVLSKGITILWKRPKVAAGGILRTINTSAWYGYVVILPVFFTSVLQFETSQWLLIWSVCSLSNMVFNVIWGMIGDKVGWLFVVRWFGCVGSAIACVVFYYVPLAYGNHFGVAMGVAVFFGCAIAAFTPLSAILPSLAPEDKGVAMSILNLGAGLSSFVGPVIVGVANAAFGMEGVAWAFGILYLTSFALTPMLKTDAQVQSKSAGRTAIAR
ncbi:Alpha-ketoglutarate permease [Bhargavaea cecembensis DSE10]|uniref:Alpha-ketoglutarate permease n=1 Tax=Bhargavaea cecembensis DSE10 TaxID=1235279 RepID=M7P079_9BACL|nr:Alpha-ketoglutarate permease [Bhargavaea cecembensis DSE10]